MVFFNELPLEIMSAIIEQMSTPRTIDGHRDLRAASLVCSSWTVFAQSRLFREIVFSDRHGHYVQRFLALVDKSPHIASHIRKLDIFLILDTKHLVGLLPRVATWSNISDLSIRLEEPLQDAYIPDLRRALQLHPFAHLRYLRIGHILFGTRIDYRWISLILQHLATIPHPFDSLTVTGWLMSARLIAQFPWDQSDILNSLAAIRVPALESLTTTTIAFDLYVTHRVDQTKAESLLRERFSMIPDLQVRFH